MRELTDSEADTSSTSTETDGSSVEKQEPLATMLALAPTRKDSPPQPAFTTERGPSSLSKSAEALLLGEHQGSGDDCYSCGRVLGWDELILIEAHICSGCNARPATLQKEWLMISESLVEAEHSDILHSPLGRQHAELRVRSEVAEMRMRAAEGDCAILQRKLDAMTAEKDEAIASRDEAIRQRDESVQILEMQLEAVLSRISNLAQTILGTV